MPIFYKTCNKCNEYLPLAMFGRAKQYDDGLLRSCKKCTHAAYVRKHPPKPNRSGLRVVNGLKKCSKCGETKPVACFSKRSRSPEGINPRCIACSSIYCKTHREQINAKRRANRREQPELVRNKQNKYQNERRRTDAAFRLRKYVSTAVSTVLKRGGAGKHGSCLKKLPFTIEELRTNLEAKWRPGFTWDNYGEVWEIDHVIPQSALPYSSMDDDNFCRCWSLDNLQPLTVSENRSKGCRVMAL